MSCFLSTSFIHLLIIPESITGIGPTDIELVVDMRGNCTPCTEIVIVWN